MNMDTPLHLTSNANDSSTRAPNILNLDSQDVITSVQDENSSADNMSSPLTTQTREPLELAQPSLVEDEIQYPTGIKLYIILMAVGLALTVSGLVSAT